MRAPDPLLRIGPVTPLVASSAHRRFAAALAHGTTDLPSAAYRLCAACPGELGVDGASLSAIIDADRWEALAASGPGATTLQTLELDLGEGPSFTAHTRARPVLVADLTDRTGDARSAWPVWADAAADAGVGAVFAFPVVIGAIRLGVLLLHRAHPGPLGDAGVAGALSAADVAADVWIRASLEPADELAGDAGADTEARDTAAPDGPELDRAEVHQATGMVMVQHGVSARDALALLRGHAFLTGRSLLEVAADVVHHRPGLLPRT